MVAYVVVGAAVKEEYREDTDFLREGTHELILVPAEAAPKGRIVSLGHLASHWGLPRAHQFHQSLE